MQSGADRGTTSHYPGLYEDGVWKCNCVPRRQAAYRLVKKDGRNKGRFFYGCATGKCKFFLWEEDALPREADSRSTQAQKRKLDGDDATAMRHHNQNPTITSPVATTPSASAGRPPITSEKANVDSDKHALGAALDEPDRGLSPIHRQWARVVTRTKPRLEELEAENARLLSRREEISENIRELRERIAREEDRLLGLKTRRRDLESRVNGRK
ncbi:hypothetical protein V1509DRAFT_617593 [Lipomyces kononenkoae]